MDAVRPLLGDTASGAPSLGGASDPLAPLTGAVGGAPSGAAGASGFDVLLKRFGLEDEAAAPEEGGTDPQVLALLAASALHAAVLGAVGTLGTPAAPAAEDAPGADVPGTSLHAPQTPDADAAAVGAGAAPPAGAGEETPADAEDVGLRASTDAPPARPRAHPAGAHGGTTDVRADVDAIDQAGRPTHVVVTAASGAAAPADGKGEPSVDVTGGRRERHEAAAARPPVTAVESRDIPTPIAEAAPGDVAMQRSAKDLGPGAEPARREAHATSGTTTPGPAQPTGVESIPEAPRAPSTSTSAPEAAVPSRAADPSPPPELAHPVARLPEGGDMRLELSPDGLGRIEVHVAVRADAVQANLYAQQDQTRLALESQRAALADALGRSNLRLEEFTVGLGQRHDTTRDDEREAPRARPLAAVEPPAAESLPLVRARGLSLRA